MNNSAAAAAIGVKVSADAMHRGRKRHQFTAL